MSYILGTRRSTLYGILTITLSIQFMHDFISPQILTKRLNVEEHNINRHLTDK